MPNVLFFVVGVFSLFWLVIFSIELHIEWDSYSKITKTLFFTWCGGTFVFLLWLILVCYNYDWTYDSIFVKSNRVNNTDVVIYKHEDETYIVNLNKKLGKIIHPGTKIEVRKYHTMYGGIDFQYSRKKDTYHIIGRSQVQWEYP